MNNIEIRYANVFDAKDLLDIYSYYVKETAISFELIVPTLKEFETRISNTLQKYPYLVILENNIIKGYAYASTYKTRSAYDWSVEVSIYVNKDSRKSGFGTLLYNELEKKLQLQNITNLYACITYPNEKSVNFHQKFGYKKIGHFTKCAYKFDKWRDIIWMEKFIGDHNSNVNEVIWNNNL